MVARKEEGGWREEIVGVIGGSGFIGRHVVAMLARRGWRVRVICRRPDLAMHLLPLGTPGQIGLVQANVRMPESLATAVNGCAAVLNLVGILAERGNQTFEAVHVRGAAAAARLAEARVFVHVSAIGASLVSPSAYGRSKLRGERAVRDIMPDAVILRPSIVVGPEDEFFNRFAAMARLAPALPLVGGGVTRLQPVYVVDIARAIAMLVENPALKRGQTLELGGPEVFTFRELMEFMLAVIRRRRPLVPVPFGLMQALAWPAQFLPGPPITPDQVRMLRRHNVVSESARREGRTFAGLGMKPEGIEAVVPPYLERYRPAGQFTVVRESLAEMLGRNGAA